MTDLEAAIAAVRPLDEGAMAAARAHLERLTKPTGSLGRLEELAITLAGITGEPAPALEPRRIVIVAGDHGIARRGVSAYPPEVTGQMVDNFLAGGAAINALAGWAGASVVVVDAGVATTLPRTRAGGRTKARLVSAPIRPGTGDISVGPAMTRQEALRSVELGLLVAADMSREGIGVTGVGEMGIGNSTSASAITAAMTGRDVRTVTGRGTGVDDRLRARKVDLIERAITVNRPDIADPIGVLAAVGGLEIGTLVGLILGSAAAGIPVVLDGFITGSAALIAAALCPAVRPRLIAAHRSPEPGHDVILERLGLSPILDLELRLGEGTGAALAIGLLDAACRVRDEMATFDSAGVSGPARSLSLSRVVC
ncbi:MAG: nicotinate-nucleotide--dimethylbenzimidazole phosphoribosyltransferase [Chloroflexota bacterium]